MEQKTLARLFLIQYVVMAIFILGVAVVGVKALLDDHPTQSPASVTVSEEAAVVSAD